MLCKPQILFLREHILSILGIAPPPVFYIGGSDTLPPPLEKPRRTSASPGWKAAMTPRGASLSSTICAL